MGPKPWDQGMSRKHIVEAIDASLKRLGTDHVDLYQLHGFDPSTPSTRPWKPWTASSAPARLAIWASPTGWRTAWRGPWVGARSRVFERDLLPLCYEEGIAVIPYNPLAGGLLTGKHDRSGAPPEGSRFTLGRAGAVYQARYWHDREFETIEALRGLAAEACMSMASMAVAWVLANPAVTAPIIGASRPEQLVESLAAAEGAPLPVDLKEKLDALTHLWRAVDAER
jgi:aryl-alcohol dehydrogenase (NADP+)